MKRTLALTLLGGALLCGCDSKNRGSTDSLPPSAAHAHEHAAEGPHHGTLVELGKEEYHVEVVHTHDSVTAYILDGQAATAVPIDAPEVTINIVHDGKPEQFKLTASPDTGDSEGKSSRFTIVDADLAAHIDDAAAAPKLSLNINGKPYRGEIKHDHHGHDHDHGSDHAH